MAEYGWILTIVLLYLICAVIASLFAHRWFVRLSSNENGAWDKLDPEGKHGYIRYKIQNGDLVSASGILGMLWPIVIAVLLFSLEIEIEIGRKKSH